jgi:hypothetical protein
MKTQDKYPYDSAVLGLNNVYQTIGDDSFYINSDCILVKDKILSIAKEYFIFNYTTVPGNKMSDILLVDCYYFEGVINLIVEEVRSHQVFTISQCLECPEKDCPWILVDLNYFHDLRDAKAIQNYCGCDYNKKPTNGESNPKAADNLLEFEF